MSSARGRPTRATIYSRLDTQTEELRTRLGGLPTPHESECVWSDIWHLEAHHSTALEGNLEATHAATDSGSPRAEPWSSTWSPDPARADAGIAVERRALRQVDSTSDLGPVRRSLIDKSTA